jgi:hypothetical protein
MKQFAVGYGMFTRCINAGRVDRTGCFTEKQDCTQDALLAVANYVGEHGGEVIVTDSVGSRARITVERLEDAR